MRVVQPFAKHMARLGHDVEGWLRPHGLTLAALEERDRRVPHAGGQATQKRVPLVSRGADAIVGPKPVAGPHPRVRSEPVSGPNLPQSFIATDRRQAHLW